MFALHSKIITTDETTSLSSMSPLQYVRTTVLYVCMNVCTLYSMSIYTRILTILYCKLSHTKLQVRYIALVLHSWTYNCRLLGDGCAYYLVSSPWMSVIYSDRFSRMIGRDLDPKYGNMASGTPTINPRAVEKEGGGGKWTTRRLIYCIVHHTPGEHK